jgi:predicted PurR-regulated permease PerM
VNPDSPWLRFLAGIVAVAVAIRVTYELLEPVLPAIAAVLVAIALWQLVRWYRGRW